MVRKLSVIAILLAVVFICPAYGQRRPVDAGYRGDRYSFREYRPKDIDRLGKLPPLVLAKLTEHLKSRLGEQFYSRLKFAWGKKIDLDELYRIELYWRKEKIGSYDLTFYFSDRKKGLKSFYSKIVLDAGGGIVEEINLPEIALYPYKAEIIPLDKAVVIAEQNGFPRERMSFNFEYNKAAESFAWIISDSQPVEPDDTSFPLALVGKGTYRVIAIDANSGNVIKIYKETIFL